MFPESYVRLDHIELAEEPALTPHEIWLRDLLPTVDVATHAMLDNIHKQLHRIPGRGRRPKLAERRAAMRTFINTRIANQRKAVIARAKKDAFIGPLTIQQNNGHPF